MCSSVGCGLRFPVEAGSLLGATCPRCSQPTTIAGSSFETHGAAAVPVRSTLSLAALLDNVRSLSNVGTIFRSADGVGLAPLHLAGITPTPAHPRLKKTALGAEASVPWQSHASGVVAAQQLTRDGWRLWALEGGSSARPYMHAVDAVQQCTQPLRVCLVVGHEVSGVDPRILAQCHARYFLPMLGQKTSLNVATALAVVAYALRFAATPNDLVAS